MQQESPEKGSRRRGAVAGAAGTGAEGGAGDPAGAGRRAGAPGASRSPSGPATGPAVSPDEAARRASADIQRQVESERIANLQALIPPTLVGGSAFAAVVGVLMIHRAPHVLVYGWVLAKLVIAAWRGIDVHRFRLADRRERGRPGWRTRLFSALWVDAAAWSALPLLFMPWLDPSARGLLVAATVGVAAVGTFSLAAHRVAAMGFLGIVLGPLTVQELWTATLPAVATAVSLGIFSAVLLVECERIHRRFSEMVKLRFENASIAEQRRRALIYAEHSNAAKTRFLASVSHELRTPLNGILGMTQLMADESLSPMQQRSLQIVQHSAEHLVSVIGDLLDLSRIEMDRISLDPRPVLVAQCVRDVADLLKPVAVERGLSFQVAFHPSLPKAALFDAGRVKQVLHNLLGNAIKYTAEGEIRVIVRLADPQTLAFEVRDTGEGVPAEAMERIFEPFEQASTHLPARGGAGLGLTISRQLARAMGGDVTCRSAPGRGARFRFTIAYVPTDQVPAPRAVGLPSGAAASRRGPAPLPGAVRHAVPSSTAAAALAEPAPSDTTATPAEATPPARIGRQRPDTGIGGRVLIVEDNEVNALVVRGMLDQLGVTSDRVTDGRQAVDALKVQGQEHRPRYDLVLMDCQMPILDGWAATREWRTLERERSRVRRGGVRPVVPPRPLPIVALTASAAAGERERCLEAGMTDYLSKPFTREDLLRVIRPFLALERLASHGGGTPSVRAGTPGIAPSAGGDRRPASDPAGPASNG